MQLRWLAPASSVLFELGAEASRGRSFPGSNRNKNGSAAGMLFARLGGDIGATASWQIGGSYLQTNPQGFAFKDTDTTTGNATTNTFSGRSKTWLADAVFKWAPSGNAKQQQLSLHGGWLRRKESGRLSCNDADAAAPTACTGDITGSFGSRQSGGYAEAVYRFAPQWRFGYRHDRLNAGTVSFGPALDPAAFQSLQSHDPKRDSFLLDFSPSEFSRFRLQFAQDRSRPGVKDNQIWLQYQMSLGAHPAHAY